MKNKKKAVSNLKIDIDKVSELANLSLSQKEKLAFLKQLGEVLGYISKLGNLDTHNVDPIGHITGLENITREDTTTPSLSQEDALKNAQETRNGFFVVDAIFEKD